MKMIDEINVFNKEYVYEAYYRIIRDSKEYEKITRKQMITQIYKEYSDYNYILELCTTCELKFLEKILNNYDSINSKEYSWERRNLRDKFIILHDWHSDTFVIPEEIIDYVKEAIKNVDWKAHKVKSHIVSIAVGYIKAQGEISLEMIAQIMSSIFGSKKFNDSKQKMAELLANDRCFSYYVTIHNKYEYFFKKDILSCAFNDYLDYIDEINEEKIKQATKEAFQTVEFEIEDYQSMFYNFFNVNRKIVKKLYEEIEKNITYADNLYDLILYQSAINGDRHIIKEAIKTLSSNRDSADKIIELLDDAMDEIPSCALNGQTPKSIFEKKEMKRLARKEMMKTYVKQTSAKLSYYDNMLFDNLFYSVLAYTNLKYKVVLHNSTPISKFMSPEITIKVIDEFFEHKEEIIKEFCEKKKDEYTNEEMDIVRGFSRAIRGNFIIMKHEIKYTAFYKDEKIYKVKGLSSNLDEIVAPDSLPKFVITTLIPFKDKIIYDGILSAAEFNTDLTTYKAMLENYKTLEKVDQL